MKIVIDLQGAQSESRHRGIGRHTSALVEAFARASAQTHEVWIATNAMLGHVEAIRAAFDQIVPQDRIVSFALPGHVSAMHPENLARMHAAELLRENFLRGMDADIVWSSSLFEGWVDDSVTSVGRLPASAVQAVTLYDLIPLSNKAKHLADPRVREWYFRKLGHLQRADLLLAISDYAREEAIELLDVAPERVHSISSAADACFRVLSKGELQHLRDGLGVEGEYVLYVGGFDDRKNVEVLVRAYAALPESLRRRHVLVLGGRIAPTQERVLRSLALGVGLREGEIVFTGSLPDTHLVALYNCCSLFVFPSLQEGFGLPVLEAMACGVPVLAANATSLPEVVGHTQMLFSPRDASELSNKMAAVLQSPSMAEAYREYGLAQADKFSWAKSAQLVLKALEASSAGGMAAGPKQAVVSALRPRLAFVSPLPPERSGVADYSAELLPSLERHYDIEVVVEQKLVSDPWVTSNYPIRDASWFMENAESFDRILYQFGNSAFHIYQLQLMRAHPGTVVLHDSFIGALGKWRAESAGRPVEYLQRLYRSHGYAALQDDRAKGRAWSVQHYPSSREVLDFASGVLVHSRYAVDQVRRFYGPGYAAGMRQIPFPKRRRANGRQASRQALGVAPDDFVVCSFGMMAPTKLNHSLINAWSKSALAGDPICHLVFVGDSHNGDYGADLLEMMKGSVAEERIRITGFVDDEQYHAWLESADLAVQLRTESRGETSAAVFDCLAHGLPLIVNAHATFAELDAGAVYLLPDSFNDAQLTSVLESFYESPEMRQRFSGRARQVIDANHSPSVAAQQYRDAIEYFASSHFLSRERELSRKLVASSEYNDEELWKISAAVLNNRSALGQRQLLIDVTGVARNDLKTGIERVTRNITVELMNARLQDIRVEPVRFHEGRYVYSRPYACELLDLEPLELPEELVEVSPGDIFLGLDWAADVVPANQGLFQAWRDRGVSVYFVVYDLLPVLRPEFFPSGIEQMHATWLRSIAHCADGVLCISRTVTSELADWLNAQEIDRRRPLHIGYFYLGAELDAARLNDARHGAEIISSGLPDLIGRMRSAPTVLMVGTIEPRKGHRLALDAFSRLWADGSDVNLVIVGKLGWMMEAFGERVRSHLEHGSHLHWLSGISDAELRALYKEADVLLAASEGEGFGLPIVEAAINGLPVIARDLPVFREVAGQSAIFFANGGPADLERAVLEWLALDPSARSLVLGNLVPMSWRESATTVWNMISNPGHTNWMCAWRTGRTCRA